MKRDSEALRDTAFHLPQTPAQLVHHHTHVVHGGDLYDAGDPEIAVEVDQARCAAT